MGNTSAGSRHPRQRLADNKVSKTRTAGIGRFCLRKGAAQVPKAAIANRCHRKLCLDQREHLVGRLVPSRLDAGEARYRMATQGTRSLPCRAAGFLHSRLMDQ
jgi:hypothetical protein